MNTGTIKSFAQKHYIALLYTLILFGLLIGLYNESDSIYSVYVGTLYILPFIVFYAGGYYLLKQINSKRSLFPFSTEKNIFNSIPPVYIINLFIILVLAVGIAHALIIQKCPGFAALWEFDYDTLIRLRKSASSGIPTLFSYIYSFTLRAVVPFAIIYTYLKGKPIQLTLLIFVAFMVAVNGMQKSFYITFFFPLALLLTYEKKYIKAGITVIGIMFSIIFMVYVTNPSLKYSVVRYFINVEKTFEGNPLAQEKIDQLDEISVSEANSSAISAILSRTIFKPGQTVGKWFDAVPSEKPFLRGKGYKLYVLFTGAEYHDYSTEMYPLLYPHYAERGYLGTVNVASFMYDYANWGLAGLPISAFIVALLLLFITVVFAGDTALGIALNTAPVLLLSSTNYTSLLFSGGWGLIILLYFVLLKHKKCE